MADKPCAFDEAVMRVIRDKLKIKVHADEDGMIGSGLIRLSVDLVLDGEEIDSHECYIET